MRGLPFATVRSPPYSHPPRPPTASRVCLPFRPWHSQLLVQTSSHIRPVRRPYCSLPFSLYPDPGPVPGEGDRELVSTQPLETEGSLQAYGRECGCFPVWPASFSLFLSLSPGHSPSPLPAEGWARVATRGPAAEPGAVGITVDPSSRPCLGVVTCLPQSPEWLPPHLTNGTRIAPALGVLKSTILLPGA